MIIFSHFLELPNKDDFSLKLLEMMKINVIKSDKFDLNKDGK